jgi:hypothetical protein
MVYLVSMTMTYDTSQRRDKFRLREGEEEDVKMVLKGSSPMVKSGFVLYTPYRDGYVVF